MLSFTITAAVLAVASFSFTARGAPTSFQTTNALAAQKLNAQFASLILNDTCTDGDQACVQGAFSSCIGGKWMAQPCAGGTTCVVLPLVNKEGTTIACDTQDDAIARMQQAGVDASLFGNNTVSTSDATSTTVGGATSVSANVNSATPTSDPEDDPECTMNMSTSVAPPSSVSTNSASPSPTVVATASVAAAAASSTSTDVEEEDCTMLDNVEIAIRPTASPAATTSVTGFTRQRFVANGAAVTDSDSLASSFVSATASTSAPLNSVSSIGAPVPVATLSNTPLSASAVPSGVQVTTVQTTMFVTVTVTPFPSVATAALSSGSSSIPASASLVQSTFAGASASSTAGPSLGAAGASSSAVLASPSVLPIQSVNTATSVASSTDLFPIPLSDITIVGTLVRSTASVPVSSSAATSSLPSATPTTLGTVVSTSSPPAATPPPTDVLSIDPASVSILITASISN